MARSAEAGGCAFRAPPARRHGTTRRLQSERAPGSQERSLAESSWSAACSSRVCPPFSWPRSPWLDTAWPRGPARRDQQLNALAHSALENTLLVAHLSNAAAFTMELSLSEKHSSTEEIFQRLQSFKSCYLDPHLKALASTLGEKISTTTRWCKRMATNACREQRRERARYVQATQKVTAQGHTCATAPDATRFSGRDWQCSPIASVDSQLWAWMVFRRSCKNFLLLTSRPSSSASFVHLRQRPETSVGWCSDFSRERGPAEPRITLQICTYNPLTASTRQGYRLEEILFNLQTNDVIFLTGTKRP